jgi:hypothetical protein
MGFFNFSLSLNAPGPYIRFFTEFPESLKKDLLGENWQGEKLGLSGFRILKIAPRMNGGTAWICEKSSVTSQEDIVYINGIPQSTSRSIFNFEDVIVLALDSTGKDEWIKTLHKTQSTVNDGGYFSSAAVAVTPRFIHVVFNDNLRNQGNVMMYSVDSEGKSSSQALLGSDQTFVSVIPSESRQISSNKLILPSMVDKKYSVYRIIFTD